LRLRKQIEVGDGVGVEDEIEIEIEIEVEIEVEVEDEIEVEIADGVEGRSETHLATPDVRVRSQSVFFICTASPRPFSISISICSRTARLRRARPQSQSVFSNCAAPPRPSSISICFLSLLGSAAVVLNLNPFPPRSFTCAASCGSA